MLIYAMNQRIFVLVPDWLDPSIRRLTVIVEEDIVRARERPGGQMGKSAVAWFRGHHVWHLAHRVSGAPAIHRHTHVTTSVKTPG